MDALVKMITAGGCRRVKEATAVIAGCYTSGTGGPRSSKKKTWVE